MELRILILTVPYHECRSEPNIVKAGHEGNYIGYPGRWRISSRSPFCLAKMETNHVNVLNFGILHRLLKYL